jgi:hypothetical protein
VPRIPSSPSPAGWIWGQGNDWHEHLVPGADSRIVLTVAAARISLGGLSDLFTPQLPPNLARRCIGNEDMRIAIRELLRSLGACLVAIGAAVGVLAITMPRQRNADAINLILTLVLPWEGMNAIGMHRVGSPYVVPLFFALLTVSGAALALIAV